MGAWPDTVDIIVDVVVVLSEQSASGERDDLLAAAATRLPRGSAGYVADAQHHAT